MPPLLVLAAVGVGAAIGLRLLKGVLGGEDNLREEASDRAREFEPKDLGSLEWDDASRVYRPRGKTN